MEWKIHKILKKETDGINGYELIGYMDGYFGNSDYSLEEFFIPTKSINKTKNALEYKVEKYSKKNDIEKMEKAIETLRSFNEIISCIEESKE